MSRNVLYKFWWSAARLSKLHWREHLYPLRDFSDGRGVCNHVKQGRNFALKIFRAVGTCISNLYCLDYFVQSVITLNPVWCILRPTSNAMFISITSSLLSNTQSVLAQISIVICRVSVVSFEVYWLLIISEFLLDQWSSCYKPLVSFYLTASVFKNKFQILQVDCGSNFIREQKTCIAIFYLRHRQNSFA